MGSQRVRHDWAPNTTSLSTISPRLICCNVDQSFFPGFGPIIFRCGHTVGFPGGQVVKNPPASAGDTEWDPWAGKNPWRKWQPSSVLSPGKSQGQRGLAVNSSWVCKESDMTEHTCMWACDTFKKNPSSSIDVHLNCFWCLAIAYMPLWAFIHMYRSCILLLSSLLGSTLGVKLFDSTAILCLSFLWTTEPSSGACTSSCPYQQCRRLPVSPCPSNVANFWVFFKQ